MATVAPDRARAWARLQDRRRRAIVLEAGPAHPEFGRAFMRYYLPHYVREHGRWVEFATMHDELFSIVFGSLGTGTWHDYLAPRGYGKSTIVTLGLPLGALGLGSRQSAGQLPYSLCRGRCGECAAQGSPSPRCAAIRWYVWIVQDSGEQARQAMEHLLDETQTNPRILQDFPLLTPMLGAGNRPVADRDDDVVFASNQRLQAVGAGQKLRGRRHRQYRPDLVLVDDLENDEHVNTKFQRDKLDKWLSSALAFALAKDGELHLVGTLLHGDAVLARVRKRDGWEHHRFEAFDAAGATTWGYRDATWHRKTKARVGATAYAREVLHIVTDEARKLFPDRLFQRDVRPAPDTPGGVRCRIGVDPAMGEKQQNDQSAIVVALRARGSDRYHVDHAWAGRVRGRALREKIAAIAAAYQADGYEPIVVFESVQAQVWGAEALAEEGLAVKPVTPGSTDKRLRAEPVALHYEMGRVTHSESLAGTDFEAELDAFPDGEHDDYVDALVWAVRELGQDHAGGLAGVVEHTEGNDDEEPFYDPRGA